jgi:hypothetical protein
MAGKTKTTKEKESKTVENHESMLMDAYKLYYLTNGKAPVSVFSFCKENNIREDEFYNQFGSFDSLEKAIWKSFIDNTIMALNESPEYNDYNFREKLLSFYYTMIEALKQNRSFILASSKKYNSHQIMPGFLAELRKSFNDHINKLIEAGLQNEEIKSRRFISDKYDEGLWVQFLFVFNFWLKDDSKGFEKTDAAIEKAVNLSTELMGESPLDSFIDFTKFIIQNVR